jgi:RNA-directed DNA polymerase
MINEGGFLGSPAMRSSGAATGTRGTTPACSISTTIGPTTRTTTSGSADPKESRLDREHAHEKPSIFGRKSPGDSPKAWLMSDLETAAGLPSAAAGFGAGSTFEKLTSLGNLFQCWWKAKQNKSQNLRIQRFGADPLRHLTTIQERLRSRAYTFGPYKTFTVREKKFRCVVDAPMKDRIVHWMLYRYLLPIWQPRFINDTFGNLPGRGSHAAVNRLAQLCRKDSAVWVLQMDISKYFYSVPHSQLKARVLRYLGDTDLRSLIVSLIDSFRTDGQFDDLFAPDSAYRRTRDKGMPIGNLSSQLFANIYLNEFDHWIKEVLGVRFYIRYVDDIVILGESREQMLNLSNSISEKLATDGLTVHPHKLRIAPTAAGVPFLGYVAWPGHISAGAYLRRRYHHRLREHQSGIKDRSEAIQSYQAALALTGTTYRG